jgi:7-cyano-7-deazaguanine synthase
MGLSGDAALVLISEGQDSTVCPGWALARLARIETIGFAYGQRHGVELAARPRIRARIAALDPAWAERLGDDRVLLLDAFD